MNNTGIIVLIITHIVAFFIGGMVGILYTLGVGNTIDEMLKEKEDI